MLMALPDCMQVKLSMSDLKMVEAVMYASVNESALCALILSMGWDADQMAQLRPERAPSLEEPSARARNNRIPHLRLHELQRNGGAISPTQLPEISPDAKYSAHELKAFQATLRAETAATAAQEARWLEAEAAAEAAAEVAAEYTEEPEPDNGQSIGSSSSAAVRAPASASWQYSDPKLTDAQKRALLVPIDTDASSGSLEARMAFKLREYSVLRAELGVAEANRRASLSPERRTRSNRTSKEETGAQPGEAPPVAAPSAAGAQDDADGAVAGARIPVPPGGTASERRRGRLTSIGSPRALPTASAPPRRPLRATPERGAAAGAPPQRPAGIGGGRPRSQQTPRGRKDGD